MRALTLIVFLLFPMVGWGQSRTFTPNENPIVNQGYSSIAITPNDTTKIAVTRAIYNGNASACNINMQLNGDSAAIVWSNVPSGAVLPVQAVLVKNASTTCTNLIAIY